MKKTIISCAVITILGLLIAFGPQYLFKVCPAHGGTFPLCHWSAQAEMGLGMLIAALGLSLLAFSDPKTQLGFAIAVFLSGILVIGIPHTLLGGCSARTMSCRTIGFPALTIEGVLLVVYSALMIVYIELKKPEKF
jgi:hypothetical protein